jgi:hypothetical protein
MGYGEFGGGGSVKWVVKHGDGDSGSGDKHGGKGKDKHPADATGIFTVIIEEAGQVISQNTVPLSSGVVRVVWGDPSVSPEGVRSLRRSTSSKQASPKGYRTAKR